MRVSLKFLGIAAFVAGVAGAGAAAAPPADLKAKADAIVEAAFPADGPGGAVIITRGGETLYAAGRGLADVEGRRPITPDTVFRLGSITKQFTAAVILQLVQEGRISLDDPVSRFFPDYPQPGARRDGSPAAEPRLGHPVLHRQSRAGWSRRTPTVPTRRRR